MKIHQEQERQIAKPSTFIDPNPIRVREMLDKAGNVIDPRTKQIIRKNDEKPE